ncbi:hypothetical protein BU17DRAFT_77911 [Hysterangium stoloniferum]|nr:hypothetical protein BU17DRAFT_77911 [Hysterangium stoloniferum]
MIGTRSLHRRKSSREDEDAVSVTITEPAPTPTPVPDQAAPPPGPDTSQLSPRKNVISAPDPPNGTHLPPPPHRQRVLSTPAQPLSAGSTRTTFGTLPPPGQIPLSPSHFRTSFTHSRAPSASFYPPSPSPLSASFPAPSSPSGLDSVPSSPLPTRPAPAPPKRHSRIHSRNLSLYFPRPGAVSPAAIAEDGAQEIEVGQPPEIVLSGGNGVPFQQGRELTAGFTFGGKRSAGDNGTHGGEGTRASRRGHHHKHSLSHNFFSFMEPEVSRSSLTPGAPTPTPMSATFPVSPSPPTHSHSHDSSHTHSHDILRSPSPNPPSSPPPPFLLVTPASLTFLTQFTLGALLWVRGQQTGSLACTGLGYWVVFDAFGVMCGQLVPSYLAGKVLVASMYGAARLETLMLFAQSIYLIFAAVYVCKEALEHALLSHGEGHHHHHQGDELEGVTGIDFPVFYILVSICTTLGTSLVFKNNEAIVGATSNRLPLSLYLDTSLPLGKVASNPYTLVPVLMAAGIAGVWTLGNAASHRPADLFIAALLSMSTFAVAYPAVVSLGKVLLQTAPERAFEKHPQILHLPPPHIWQLSSATSSSSSSSPASYPAPHTRSATLVVTLELHISHNLTDEAALRLTRWAWEKCVGSLGGKEVAEVTVGVVKG